MAKHNFVVLNGYIKDEPTFIPNKENCVRCICAVYTIRGVRDFGNNIDNLKYDAPIIMTGNPDIIKKMKDLKEGDMVEIKGSITTKDIIKNVKCKNCGHDNKRKGNIVYINPIFFDIRERGLPENKRNELLKTRCEISNQVTMIGPVCREPKVYKTEKGLYITTYQMAVRRKYRIKDDSPDVKTDFPWIKSYGAIAKNDIKSIKKGSYIFVDGMLQTRELTRHQVCEECGAEREWKDSAMEVVPFATEYLRDYYTVEEIAAREREEGQKAAEEVLNEFEVDANRPLDKPDFEEEADADEESGSNDGSPLNNLF
jgi:single-stranded DNA-binding protein